MNTDEIENNKKMFDGFINPKISTIIDPTKNKHDRMKLLGRKILFYMGIPSNCIEEEVTIDYGHKKYRVDLVGRPLMKINMYSEEFRIAIECGDNKAEKIEALRNTFPLVLIMPYNEFDVSMQPEIQIVQKIIMDLDKQMISGRYYIQEMDKLKKEFDNMKQSIYNDSFIKMDSFRKDMDALIHKQIEDYEKRIGWLKSDLDKYEESIKHLKEFKRFCKEFSEI